MCVLVFVCEGDTKRREKEQEKGKEKGKERERERGRENAVVCVYVRETERH